MYDKNVLMYFLDCSLRVVVAQAQLYRQYNSTTNTLFTRNVDSQNIEIYKRHKHTHTHSYIVQI